MEPDTVNTPKINRDTFKIGSGDLQQKVAVNSRKITILSNIIKSRRSDIGKKITPQRNSIQETLAESNIILADIAIKLQEDFQSREQREKFLLQKNRNDKLALRRQNAEEQLETQKTENRIVKSTKKIKTPLDGLFKGITKILLLFGGLTLIKTIFNNKDAIFNSEAFKNTKAALESVFSTLVDNMDKVLIVGGAILGLKLVSTLGSIFTALSGLITILANPLLLAGIGILYAAAKQGLGKDEKDVIDELEKMGGFSKENRDKLIERLKAEKEKMIFTNVAGKAEVDRKIRFLETGGYGYNFAGKPVNVFDFSTIDQLTEISDFDKFMLEFDPNYKVKNMVKDDSNNNVSFIELPGETIDLRKGKIIEENNGINASKVAYVSASDLNNKYINEFPELMGFNDMIG